MKVNPQTTERINAMLASGQAVEVGRKAPEPLPEKAMPEKEWMWKVTNFAEEHGWRVFHCYDARRSAAGFPDLILVRHRVIVAELKKTGKRPTKAQTAWLEAFERAAVQAFCWRPSDWAQIEEILR